MHEQAIGIYCICTEIVECFGIIDDPQCQMITSEVMTFALISAIHYQCDYRKTQLVIKYFHYFNNILSVSRIVRRIHKIPEHVWMMVFTALKIYLSKSNVEYFIIDSFPVKAYETYKSFRAKIFRGKDYHGYSASRKSYFFGIKVHMIVDENGIPIEFCFTPGSVSDLKGMQALPCELPSGCKLLGDKAYTDYLLEDNLSELANINFLPRRKHNLTRQHHPSRDYIISKKRNRIEVVFSNIVGKMPRQIKARTERGFYIKVTLYILAYVVERALPVS